ncbi:MAG: signal peptide peptidase SppA [Bdellovibrionaceae bacterium]|nr:signal peptide peptidase SppA [Bdellovibrio sp.]
MKPWSFRKKFVFGLVIVIVGILFYRGYKSYSSESARSLTKNEILHLELHGVIMNGKKFLTSLKKYQKDDSIKAIVVDINSPGGAVGPSQEIYYEIMRAKKETGKPVVCVSTGLIASGGYYSALACDKIVVAPGTMIGSIGVIMEFANLERLYDWAKISRYTIKSGKFKDSGAEYRAMRDDERKLFQDMIDEVYAQFRDAVVEARHLPVETVNAYADGRVMTGAKAVELKFADSIGTFEDAVKIAARDAGLGEDYKVFKPHKEKSSILDYLTMGDDDDDLNSLSEIKGMLGASKKSSLTELTQIFLKTKYLNQPLYLMPGYWE